MNKTKITKAPGAKTNSFTISINNCMSLYPNTFKGQRINANVMFSSDEYGETISVLDPSTGKQIILPFKQIEELIEYTRHERTKHREVTGDASDAIQQ